MATLDTPQTVAILAENYIMGIVTRTSLGVGVKPHCEIGFFILKVIYHPLYSMNKFVTNKSKLPQDGAQLFPYMG